MSNTFFILGGILGTLAVAAGAFSSHVLKERLSAELVATFEVAARYHMYHSLALFGAAWAADRWPGRLTAAAGCCFCTGTVVFSGSLYLRCLTDTRWLGAVTPVGGLALIAGWLCLVAAAWAGSRK